MPALKFLYQRLLAGESFGVIEQHRLGGTYFWDVLHANNKYIYLIYYYQKVIIYLNCTNII
jgi:hypothetical protein